jgi:hypothetical protein
MNFSVPFNWRKGGLLLGFFFIPAILSAKPKNWPPLSEKIKLGYFEGKSQTVKGGVLPKEVRVKLLKWVEENREVIDSMASTHFGVEPGDFEIRREAQTKEGVLVRLFAPSLVEHCLYAGVQLECILKDFYPRVIYLSAVPWE